ncbi:hypothetical protein D3C71_1368850 [compost metagenome]
MAVEGMIRTQLSYGVMTGSPSDQPITVPALASVSRPFQGSAKRKSALLAATACVTRNARCIGAPGANQPAGTSPRSTVPASTRKRAIWSTATPRASGAP